MKLQGFVGGSYKMDATQYDCQRAVNLFPIASEVGSSKEPSALRSIAGYELYANIGGGNIRGMKATGNGRSFIVSGFLVYELLADGTLTFRGNLGTGTGVVSIEENGLQLMLVDGAGGYILDFATNVFSAISDPDFPPCDSVTFQDGYFIVSKRGTSEYYISALYDGLSWDVLDFGRADSNPDTLVAVVADGGNLWCFGNISIEVHQNTGDVDFPYQRISGAVTQVGCLSWSTIKSYDNALVWLGRDDNGGAVVWKSTGYTAGRISTQAIEAILATAPTFVGSYAYVYQEQGQIFYCLQVTGLKTTLVYSVSTGLWHERQYKNPISGNFEQHRGSCHMYFNGRNLIGDRQTGVIYEQRLGLYTFNGEPIYRKRITPHIQDEKRNLTFSSVELDMETGVGLVSGQGSDPLIMMQYSDDGGLTWSNERMAPVGKLGKYRNRVRWSRCGSGRNRVWSFAYTEPTFCQLNACYVNAT